MVQIKILDDSIPIQEIAGRLTILEKYGIYTSLTDLKNASVSNSLPYVLLTTNGKVDYTYILGDFSGKADDINIVKLKDIPLSTGALVKHNSANVSVPQIANGFLTLTDKIRERISIKDFGAIGDGIVDDRAAIQRGIDWLSARGGGTLMIPVGIYKLGFDLAPGGGICCLVLKPGVSLIGENRFASILKVSSNLGFGAGTYFRGICTDGHCDRILLSNFTFDGNRSGQGAFARQGNGGNIVIEASECVVDGVRSIEANGQGIQLRGGPGSIIEVASVVDCFVSGCSGSTLNQDGSVRDEFNGNGIGIQIGYAKDIHIARNTVRGCKDNAVDTFNESGSFDALGGGLIITGNILRSCRVGVFPETSARVRVTNNYIDDMLEAGIALNRINSAPSDVMVSGNTIRTTLVGIRVSGNMDSLVIADNYIANITNFNGGCIGLYTAANILIKGNTFKPNNADIPFIRTGDAQAVFISIADNYYFGTPTVNRMIVRGAADHFDFSVWGQFLPANGSTHLGSGEGDTFSRNKGSFSSMRVGGGLVVNSGNEQGKTVLPANATDLTSAQTLLNAVKAILISTGYAKEQS